MKKVLFTATVDSHIMNFHIPYLKYFKDNGFEVHVASNGDEQIPSTDFKYNVPFQRSPYKKDNLKAYIEIKKILSNNNFDLIHCHTPVGAVITRLAARKYRKFGAKVVYTAHGFHFFKGAPLINWVLFYPIEKLLSRYTDCLITINSEDFKAANLLGFQRKLVEHVNGVGVNAERFRPYLTTESEELRLKNGYTNDQFLIIYAAELNKNKNQEFLIKSVSKLKDSIPKIRLLLVGRGMLSEYYKDMCSNEGLEAYIDFLDYREDLHELYPMCNVAVASSIREGLPVNIIEAMSCGLPIVASNNRGHRDLVEHNKSGYLFDLNAPDEFSKYILKLYGDNDRREHMRLENIARSQKYSLNHVMSQMINIYNSYL